eukprot:58803-Chlamydomonas_euryale.AAC.3
MARKVTGCCQAACTTHIGVASDVLSCANSPSERQRGGRWRVAVKMDAPHLEQGNNPGFRQLLICPGQQHQQQRTSVRTYVRHGRRNREQALHSGTILALCNVPWPGTCPRTTTT